MLAVCRVTKRPGKRSTTPGQRSWNGQARKKSRRRPIVCLPASTYELHCRSLQCDQRPPHGEGQRYKPEGRSREKAACCGKQQWPKSRLRCLCKPKIRKDRSLGFGNCVRMFCSSLPPGATVFGYK